MLLEAVNSVFFTYVVTEYILSDASLYNGTRRGILGFTAAVLVLNLFVRYHDTGTAIAEWVHGKLDILFNIPRIVVAFSSFLTALYFDCRRKYTESARRLASPASFSTRYFVKTTLKSFCKLLPVYPFLAVVISFGFLIVVTVFEKLQLPLDVLNYPIYYGTLYGPLMFLYFDVKKTVTRCGNILPV